MAKESRWTIVAFEAVRDDEIPDKMREQVKGDDVVMRYDFRDGHEGRKLVYCRFTDLATMRTKGQEQARQEFVRQYGGSIDGNAVVMARNALRYVY